MGTPRRELIPGSTKVVSRIDTLWTGCLAYEPRSIVYIPPAGRRSGLVVCGDKSGAITAFGKTGAEAWKVEEAIGPIYGLGLVKGPEGHPLDSVIAAVAGSGHALLLSPFDGSLLPIRHDNKEVHLLRLAGTPRAMVSHPFDSEIYVGTDSGTLHRFSLAHGGRRLVALHDSPLDIREPLTALAILKSQSGRLLIAAGTALGSVRLCAPTGDWSQVLLAERKGIIRAILDLGTDVDDHSLAAIAVSGEVLLTRHCEDVSPNPRQLCVPVGERVFDLLTVGFPDSSWLAIGGSNGRLQFVSISHAHEQPHRVAQVGDRHFSVVLPDRVLHLAAKRASTRADQPVLFVALGDHTVRAIRVRSQRQFAQALRQVFGSTRDLPQLSAALAASPYDRGLHGNAAALLFHTNWLCGVMRRTSHTAGIRVLRVVVLQLLASRPFDARSILNGLARVSSTLPHLSQLAAELTEFADKFSVDGPSYSRKTIDLGLLAQTNELHGNRYLYDAVAYRSLIADRGHIERQHVACHDRIGSLASLAGSHVVVFSTQRRHDTGVLDALSGGTTRLPFGAGREVQQSLLWRDPVTGAVVALFLSKAGEWTAYKVQREPVDLPLSSDDAAGGGQSVPPVEAVCALQVSDDTFALGDRGGAITFLGVGLSGGRIRLRVLARRVLSGSRATAVAALSVGRVDGGALEVLAGCDGGTCYRVVWTRGRVETVEAVWSGSSAIKAVFREPGGAVGVAEGAGLLHFLRPKTTDGTLVPVWSLRFGAGVSAATVVPSTARNPCVSVVVADNLGRLHVIDAEKLICRGFVTLGREPVMAIDHLACLQLSDGEQRLAVASADGVIRVVELVDPAEARRSLARAVARLANFRGPAVRGRPGRSQDRETRLAAAALDVLEVAQLQSGAWLSVPQQVVPTPIVGPAERLSSDLACALAAMQVGSPLLAAFIDAEHLSARTLSELCDDIELLLPSGGDRDTRRVRRLGVALRYGWRALAGAPPSIGDDRGERVAQRFIRLCREVCLTGGGLTPTHDLLMRLSVVDALSSCLLELARTRPGVSAPGLPLAEEMTELFRMLVLSESTDDDAQRVFQLVRWHLTEAPDTSVGVLAWHFVPIAIAGAWMLGASGWDASASELLRCCVLLEERAEYSLEQLTRGLVSQNHPAETFIFLAARVDAVAPRSLTAHRLAHAVAAPAATRGQPFVAAAATVLVDTLASIGEGSDGGPRADQLQALRAAAAIVAAFHPDTGTDAAKSAERAIREPAAAPLEPVTHRLLSCATSILDMRLRFETGEPEQWSTYEALRAATEEMAGIGAATSAETAASVWTSEAARILRLQIDLHLDFIAAVRFVGDQSRLADNLGDDEDLADSLRHFQQFLQRIMAPHRTIAFVKTLGDVGHELIVTECRTGSSCTSERVTPVTAPDRLRRFARYRLARTEVDLASLYSKQSSRSTEVPTPVRLPDDRMVEWFMLPHSGDARCLLVFDYGQGVPPSPLRRALTRSVAEVLTGEFIRSAQANRLLAAVFHHIGSPVAAMEGIIGDLETAKVPPGDVPNSYRTLRRLVADCDVMISNQQNWMRALRGIAIPLEATPFDLREEIEFRRRLIGHKYKPSRHTISLAGAPSEVRVRLDRVLVGDIIQNLLDNACKYSPDGTAVTVTLREKRKDVFIDIADRGPGLPDYVWSALYEEGARGARIRPTREGLGLGLFMVKTYVSLMDGQIWPESMPDGGTTFTVRLPREL